MHILGYPKILFGYTWVSFGLEAVSWRLLAIYTVLPWPPYDDVGFIAAWSSGEGALFRSRGAGGLGGLCRSVAGRRSALYTYSVLLGRRMIVVGLTAPLVSDRLAARARLERTAGRASAAGVSMPAPGWPPESAVSDKLPAGARLERAPGRGRGRRVSMPAPGEPSESVVSDGLPTLASLEQAPGRSSGRRGQHASARRAIRVSRQ